MGIRNAFDRMIQARERQARSYVRAAVAQMDDETLRRAGIDRKDVGRGTGAYPY